MRIFIGKLCVFVLLINFFCFPSDQHAAAYITDSRIVLANIAPWLKKGYASFYLEWVGFSIFFSCLGYAVARRFFQNEKELITIAHELETARQIHYYFFDRINRINWISSGKPITNLKNPADPV